MRDLIVQMQRMGIVVVASAGNSREVGSLGFPACLEGVYAAAALSRQERYSEKNLELASYSNIDYTGVWALPIGGVLIENNPWGERMVYVGTSFAAPMLAAILFQYHSGPIKRRRGPNS